MGQESEENRLIHCGKVKQGSVLLLNVFEIRTFVMMWFVTYINWFLVILVM